MTTPDDPLRTLLHDIQTPLTVIRGYIRTTPEAAMPPADREAYRQAALASLDKLTALLEQLRSVQL